MSLETSVETGERAGTTSSSVEHALEALGRDLDEVRDVLSVGRVFGDPVEHAGVTVIPVARIAGGAGGGGGEESSAAERGGGFGTGFGLGARPVGVVAIDADGNVCWRPTVDATVIARSGQVLAGIVAVCLTLVLLRRRR